VYLRGDIALTDEAGAVRLRDTRVALCRCGLSRNKPLCDNMHREAGFHDPGAVANADGPLDAAVAGGTLRVTPKPNGPIELSGPFALSSADRKTMLAGSSAALCRCGQSRAKPFCDNSHERAGFRSE
jgi:CDGSH-type Zn-finger protein